MYVPPHFALDDLEEIAALVSALATADLVTVDSDGSPESSLLPVTWDRAPSPAGPYGRLIAHAAVLNQQWTRVVDGARALAVVRGPQAYISPSWYAAKAEHGRVVPTWNYSAVHFSGTIELVRDAELLRGIVTALTDLHEGRRPDPWAVSEAPSAYIDGQLRAIIGVVVHIDRIEAKAKLSQNRSAADQDGVVAGLRADPLRDSAAIADAMDGRAR